MNTLQSKYNLQLLKKWHRFLQKNGFRKSEEDCTKFILDDSNAEQPDTYRLYSVSDIYKLFEKQCT